MNGKMKFRVALLIGIFAAALILTTGQILANNANNNQKGDYIIVFKEGVDPEAAARELAAQYGLHGKGAYHRVLKGMSANIPEQKLEALRNDYRVAFVEEDVKVSVAAQSTPTGITRIFATSNANLTINGVDDLRIDADVAVLDTGIDLQHTDLNVVMNVNCLTGTCVNGGGDDDQYHGTHVAGTIGALDNGFGVVGVAPGARLWAVKVLDANGDGTISSVIAGLDFVAQNAANIEVANLSLTCDCVSEAMNLALADAVNANVTVVVAAGNFSLDAANYSPANSAEAITVSALADFNGVAGGGGAGTCRTDVDDTLADFSNYGTGVDVIAPGTCIYSTYPIEKGSYANLSGTSMAAPHVAGAAALIASAGDFTPAQIKQQLISSANYNWVETSPDGVQEPLLDVSNAAVYHPATVVGTPVSNGAPTVQIKSPANNATFSASALVNFWGAANDPEQGYMSDQIIWTSSRDGQFGTGSSFNKTLTAGTHVITARVTDAQGATTTASITITFGSGTPAPTTVPTNTPLPTSTPLPTNTQQPTSVPGSGLGIGVHQENVAAISFSGTWVTDNNAGASGGQYRYTNALNAKVTFSFTGNKLTLYRAIAFNRGAMNVCIDGTCQSVQNYSSVVVWQAPVSFTVAEGTHSVEIINLSNSYIDLDALKVESTAVSPTAQPTTAPTSTSLPTIAPTNTAQPTTVPTNTPLPTIAPTNTAQPTTVPTNTPLPTNPPSSGITLSGLGYKVKGYQTVDLSWSGAIGTNVDIYHNGVKIVTTANDGFYTHSTNIKGSGAFFYKVCQAGTTTCSNEVIVGF